jgi:hypothetical protein
MSLTAQILFLWRDRTREDAETCFACTHFQADPSELENSMPGLSSLSSGHASVRSQDGLCDLHDRIINGQRRCSAFAQAPDV